MNAKIVYTYGVFDLLHIGHIESIKKAKNCGQKLIVGIFTDKVAETFKRETIIDQETRKATIEALGIADQVVYQDELSPSINLIRYGANIVAKGPGAGFEKPEFEFNGVEKILLQYHGGISTSEIIKKIKGEQDGLTILSNNLIGRINVREKDVIRLNLAWIETVDEAHRVISKISNDLYLDYPTGRTKPPKTKITLEEAIDICNLYKPRFFAFSNAEDPEFIKNLRQDVDAASKLVPKIESKDGVDRFEEIVAAAQTDVAMLDKEDLYTLNRDDYERLVLEVREKAKKNKIHLLELTGVVFN